MTTCLRTFALHNLHPKLSLIRVKRSSAASAAFKPSPSTRPNSASTFLHEFLEPIGRCTGSGTPAVDRASWLEIRCLVPVSVLLHPSSSAITSEAGCHTYDPRLHTFATTKPRSLSADDIIVACGQRLSPDNDVDDVYRDCMSTVDVLPYSVGCWHRQCSPLSEYEKSMILASYSSDQENQGSRNRNDPTGKPTDEQLQRVSLKLGEDLPKFFTRVLDYSIYHQDLVFQNNIRGVTTRGLMTYVRQMSVLRMIGHLRFAFVQLDVLKLTTHPEDGTVRVRWRIQGIVGYKIFLQFWKFRIWRYKEMISEKKSDWYDAFSTFYVGGDGLIHRHVCDKMMPDEQKTNLSNNNINLAAKLAFLLGAIPRPSVDDLGAMMMAFSRLQGLPNFDSPETTSTSTSSTTTSTTSD